MLMHELRKRKLNRSPSRERIKRDAVNQILAMTNLALKDKSIALMFAHRNFYFGESTFRQVVMLRVDLQSSSASPPSRQLPVNRPKALLTYAMRAFVGIHHCQLAFLRGTMRARIRLRALTFSEYPLVHRGQGSVAGAMLHFFHAAK